MKIFLMLQLFVTSLFVSASVPGDLIYGGYSQNEMICPMAAPAISQGEEMPASTIFSDGLLTAGDCEGVFSSPAMIPAAHREEFDDEDEPDIYGDTNRSRRNSEVCFDRFANCDSHCRRRFDGPEQGGCLMDCRMQMESCLSGN